MCLTLSPDKRIHIRLTVPKRFNMQANFNYLLIILTVAFLVYADINEKIEIQQPHFINGAHNEEYHKIKNIHYAVIRSDMPGRRLNHLPQVQEFLREDVNQ